MSHLSASLRATCFDCLPDLSFGIEDGVVAVTVLSLVVGV